MRDVMYARLSKTIATTLQEIKYKADSMLAAPELTDRKYDENVIQAVATTLEKIIDMLKPFSLYRTNDASLKDTLNIKLYAILNKALLASQHQFINKFPVGTAVACGHIDALRHIQTHVVRPELSALTDSLIATLKSDAGTKLAQQTLAESTKANEAKKTPLLKL